MNSDYATFGDKKQRSKSKTKKTKSRSRSNSSKGKMGRKGSQAILNRNKVSLEVLQEINMNDQQIELLNKSKQNAISNQINNIMGQIANVNDNSKSGGNSMT